jgi:sigma-E factor negative regulatory protein RseA
MEPTNREDLSALMDGELGAEPTRFLLRRLDHDPELSATWSRWHLIRACLASDPARMSAPRVDNDFAARIAAALAEDGASQTGHRNWARYVGGGALAAGVAAVALMLHAPGAPVGQAVMSKASASGPSVPSTQVASVPARETAPAWMLPRQPTVFSAQPASADVVYGTGLMQPDYLRRAAYAREESLPYETSFPDGMSYNAPFSIVLVPQAPASSAQATSHR